MANAIDRNQGAEAYDQVVVGYLLQIAAELKNTTGADAEALRRRTARLISALKPETLRRLLTMGGQSAQRNAFVLDATHGMAVDAVIDIVKAAADANGQTISHGLVRMLTKLSTQAENGHEVSKPAADSALREQVQSLLNEWQLADPNPEDYRHMLQYLATSAPAGDQTRHRGGAAERSATRADVARGRYVGPAGGPFHQHLLEGRRRGHAGRNARSGTTGKRHVGGTASYQLDAAAGDRCHRVARAARRGDPRLPDAVAVHREGTRRYSTCWARPRAV